METVADFIFLSSKITADGVCSHEIKRRLLLGRKVMTNLDSILKSRDITLSTKVHLVVKAKVFPVVMYGCENWTIKKAEHQRIDAFELWCWRRLLRVPWTARRSNQSILKEISPGCSLEGLMLKLKRQYFSHLIHRVDSLEKTLMLGKIEGRRRRQQWRWDSWMASPTQWTWVWLDSGSWWWTGRPGVLWFMELQRVGHDWVTELNWTQQRMSLWEPQSPTEGDSSPSFAISFMRESESKVNTRLHQPCAMLPRRLTSVSFHVKHWGVGLGLIISEQLRAARSRRGSRQLMWSQQLGVDSANLLRASTKRLTHELHRMTCHLQNFYQPQVQTPGTQCATQWLALYKTQGIEFKSPAGGSATPWEQHRDLTIRCRTYGQLNSAG